MPTGSSPRPASGADLALEISGISFAYANSGNGTLYEDFSLEVERGSIVAIMGPSGSGKTTLGRMMAGILSPQRGSIRRSPEFERPADVVYLDQHPINSVFPWQTVRRNLCYPLEKLGWDPAAIAARASYLISLFRLEGLAAAYPAHLSGGELQRLALARCLSWRPKLVVLDEPFSALDGKVKEEISAALVELAEKEFITQVLITHNVADALALGTRCIVLCRKPVRIIADHEFRSGFPRREGAPDYEKMQQTLITGIRHGLV